MESHQIDGRFDPLHFWCRLLHKLLPRTNHVLQRKVHWEECYRFIYGFAFAGLLLHSHLRNSEDRDLVESFLELWRFCHSLFDGLLSHFWCKSFASLEFLAILRIHRQQHAGTEKILCIWNKAVFNSLCRFGIGIIIPGFLQQNFTISVTIQKLEPDFSERKCRDLQVHIFVNTLQLCQSSIRSQRIEEKVENTRIIIRFEDNPSTV
mmetsp:Transcript_24944/g.58527  ORF Transcript_24944/g.58527 Transcript_24944/m.58527 type:complete len:207 (+) Transcript_24944:235-855(+)